MRSNRWADEPKCFWTELYTCSFHAKERKMITTSLCASLMFSVNATRKSFFKKIFPFGSTLGNPQLIFIIWDQLTVCLWMEACFSKTNHIHVAFKMLGRIKMTQKSQILLLKQCFFFFSWGRAETTKCACGSRNTWTGVKKLQRRLQETNYQQLPVWSVNSICSASKLSHSYSMSYYSNSQCFRSASPNQFWFCICYF